MAEFKQRSRKMREYEVKLKVIVKDEDLATVEDFTRAEVDAFNEANDGMEVVFDEIICKECASEYEPIGDGTTFILDWFDKDSNDSKEDEVATLERAIQRAKEILAGTGELVTISKITDESQRYHRLP